MFFYNYTIILQNTLTLFFPFVIIQSVRYEYADVVELADTPDLGSSALKFADMAELADAIDLGSIVNRRAGSSPVIRIK